MLISAEANAERTQRHFGHSFARVHRNTPTSPPPPSLPPVGDVGEPRDYSFTKRRFVCQRNPPINGASDASAGRRDPRRGSRIHRVKGCTSRPVRANADDCARELLGALAFRGRRDNASDEIVSLYSGGYNNVMSAPRRCTSSSRLRPVAPTGVAARRGAPREEAIHFQRETLSHRRNKGNFNRRVLRILLLLPRAPVPPACRAGFR